MKIVNKGPQIKYDKIDMKIGLVIAIICTIASVAAIVMMNLPILDRMSAKLTVLIVIGGIYCFPLLAIVGWRLFFSSLGYMKRLEMYGYKTPERKKTYHGRQDLLERIEVNPQDVNKWHPESVILSFVAWVAGVCSLPYPFYVWQYYPDMDGVLIVMLFPVACWILLGLFYWRQRDRLKYKDDVELDEKRKTRQNLVDGLVTILVCIFLTIIFWVIMYNLAGVIYKSRLAAGWYQS
ncbi:MAG: hypothetical protein IJX63_05540 [Lachnospiraceae bacterium]|nr:hypothetical protein [Lachnospiraceae bacterium]